MKINLHSHHKDARQNELVIVNQYPETFAKDIANCSVGIHPWYIDVQDVDKQLDLMSNLVLQPNCLFVGEIGLDKLSQVDYDLQKTVFKRQLILAKQVNKPVILHIVRAFEDIWAIVKEIDNPPCLIVHGFNKKLALAMDLINKGFYLSFGKDLLKREHVLDVFKAMPKERVFLETDTESNELLELIYQKAEQVSPSIEQQIQENFKQVLYRKP